MCLFRSLFPTVPEYSFGFPGLTLDKACSLPLSGSVWGITGTAAVPALLCWPQGAAMGPSPVCTVVAHSFLHQASLLLLLTGDSQRRLGEFLES